MRYILLLLLLSSCRDSSVKEETKPDMYRGRNIIEVEYDGCQYVMFETYDGYGSWGGHKGNCNNPIHLNY